MLKTLALLVTVLLMTGCVDDCSPVNIAFQMPIIQQVHLFAAETRTSNLTAGHHATSNQEIERYGSAGNRSLRHLDLPEHLTLRALIVSELDFLRAHVCSLSLLLCAPYHSVPREVKPFLAEDRLVAGRQSLQLKSRSQPSPDGRGRSLCRQRAGENEWKGSYSNAPWGMLAL